MPVGKYHVEGLEVKVMDAENVRLVFNKHKMSEGDTFKAYSDSQPLGLEFTINEVEELKAEGKYLNLMDYVSDHSPNH